MNSRILLIALGVILIAAGIALISYEPRDTRAPDASPRPLQPKKSSEMTRIGIGTTTITAEVVRSPEAKRRGLSYRPELSDGSGMLFVYRESDQHGFWMKDMQFAIDIIWLNKDKKIVHVERNVSPNTYPKPFTPDEPARYVLEVNAGDADAYNLKEGDMLEFEL